MRKKMRRNLSLLGMHPNGDKLRCIYFSNTFLLQDDLMQFAIKELKFWSFLLRFFFKMKLFKGNKYNFISSKDTEPQYFLENT